MVSGDCFDRLFTFTNSTGSPIDVSGWVLSCQIRNVYDDPNILATGTFSNTDLATNQWALSFTSEDTAGLPVKESTGPGNFPTSKFTYDVRAVVTNGCEYTIQRGSVYLSPSVTK